MAETKPRRKRNSCQAFHCLRYRAQILVSVSLGGRTGSQSGTIAWNHSMSQWNCQIYSASELVSPTSEAVSSTGIFMRSLIALCNYDLISRMFFLLPSMNPRPTFMVVLSPDVSLIITLFYHAPLWPPWSTVRSHASLLKRGSLVLPWVILCPYSPALGYCFLPVLCTCSVSVWTVRRRWIDKNLCTHGVYILMEQRDNTQIVCCTKMRHVVT